MQELRQRMYEELPALASELILGERYRNRYDPYRRNYASSPDDPLMHSPAWHQWGVITHTRKVGEQFEQTLPLKLGEWFGAPAAERRLGLRDESVDGVSKWELLLCAVPAHDWGKFTVRGLGRTQGDQPKFRFGGHEAESGALVRARKSWFAEHGVTPAQLEYIARCAELHFELGKVRDAARQFGGYNLDWVRGDGFSLESEDVAFRRRGFEREIGLFFLADNWGKTDLLDSTEFPHDQAIAEIRPRVKADVKKRNLEPRLVECALQLPVNTAAGKRFLELHAI